MRDWIENEFLVPALAYNIDYNLFWTLTPRTLNICLSAKRKAIANEQNMTDMRNFQLGSYMMYAIAQCLSTKRQSIYPKKPLYQISESDLKGAKEYTEEQKEMLRKIYVQQLERMRKDYQKRHQ